MTRLRLLLLLYAALWIAACAGAIVMVWNDGQKLDIELGEWNLQAFIASDSTGQWSSTAVFSLLILIGLATMLLSLRPISPAARGSLRLKQVTGGEVEVTAENLQLLLSSEITQLSEVYHAEATVSLKGSAVATRLDLRIRGNTNIAAVTHAASERLTEVFRDQVGVTDIKRPLIRVEYEGDPMPAFAPGPPGALPTPPEPALGASPSQTTDLGHQSESAEPGADDHPPLPPPPVGESDDDD